MKSTNAGQSSKKAEREHSARYLHSVPTHQPTEGDADSLYTAGDQCVIMQNDDVLRLSCFIFMVLYCFKSFYFKALA